MPLNASQPELTRHIYGVAVDLGTNTESALWDGRRLLLTSVPGGPAFEGVGIRATCLSLKGTKTASSIISNCAPFLPFIDRR
jgi:uncharacterized 2Fe-2S/4Fe-4S cluster protein (DUF4445 family)